MDVSFGNQGTGLAWIEGVQRNISEKRYSFGLSEIPASSHGGSYGHLFDPRVYINHSARCFTNALLSLGVGLVARPVVCLYDLLATVPHLYNNPDQAKNHIKSALKAIPALLIDVVFRVCVLIKSTMLIVAASALTTAFVVYTIGCAIGEGIKQGIRSGIDLMHS